LVFPINEAVTIGIIGACDGPTVIYVASKVRERTARPCSVAAYSYMSLVPLLQPPIMRMLTTKKERETVMKTHNKTVSDTTALLFPIVITVIGGLIAPMGFAASCDDHARHFMKESGAVARLTKASENEIANIVTLFLGLSIGATMIGPVFVKPQTILILALGLLAICLDTVFGILFGKILYLVTGGKINPLIGAAGFPHFPCQPVLFRRKARSGTKRAIFLCTPWAPTQAARLVQVMAAAVMLSVLKGMGVIINYLY